MRTMLILVISLFGQVVAMADDIYENPQNLKVLSKDITPGELRDTMKNFAISTGLRCSSCHVGEESQPLQEYDFAADEKPRKKLARAMLELTQGINNTISGYSTATHVQVECVTCHRGVPQPKMLAAVLAEAADEQGVAGIQQQYQTLRSRYYGTHSYDFSDFTLTEFAQSRALAGHTDQAYAVLDILLADNPESFMGHFAYGELANREGNAVLAKTHYARAMELNSSAAGFLQQRIDQLQE